MGGATHNAGSQRDIVVVGLTGIAWVLLVTALVIFAFNQWWGHDHFVHWVSYAFMCATPFQIMQAVVWHNSIPARLSGLSQPARGLAIVGCFILASIIVMPLLYFTVGQGALTPILLHFVIQSVVVTLFVILALGCWPVSRFCRTPGICGLATLAFCYLLNLVIFCIFYDYAMFEGLPFYAHVFAPSGLFNGITALTFAVTSAAILMLATMLDFWPMSKWVDNAKQPLMGIVTILAILAVALMVYGTFVHWLGMDPMAFMVKGPVCIIFGTFLVQNMMQFQLLASVPQPQKGLLKILLCGLCAALMYQLYLWALPVMAGTALPAGPSAGYGQEIWIASAMLGVTFPIINFVSGGFDFWPVKRNK